jgi:hypothetical protein
MNTYPITDIIKNHEWQNIKTILRNNNYPAHKHQRKHKSNHTEQNTEPIKNKKWAIFTYVGKETRNITRLFRNTNIHTSFKITNTMKNHLKSNKHTRDTFNKSGINQLKCNDCPLKCLGQTGRNFRTYFNEHIQAIKTNKPNSKFAQHVIDTQHTYDIIEKTMDILHIEEKPLIKYVGAFLHRQSQYAKTTNERYIYRHTKSHF